MSTKTDKLYKRYEKNFNGDIERITTLGDFAKTAIQFIIEKGLYVEFVQYMSDKASKAL